MICSNCGTENEPGRKFCMECGARLAVGCPTCGAQNPDSAKFCGECGSALQGDSQAVPTEAARSSAPSPATAERRLVTILFADLVGFTTRAEDEDPEDTREFLTRYFDLMRTIVERYGGTIEKFIGDAVMAVWGAPTAHEDDAERAVRAALDVVSAVPGIGGEMNVQVRAGVMTGEAAVTLGAAGQGMVAGDLVNTASRLQSVAPPGSVLVGEATYRAASGAVAFEEAGEQVLKGRTAPVPAWRARSIVAMRGGSGRSSALEPPFVGRHEELRQLKELFHATERERKLRLVSVTGQAGIGKSRLAWEFEKYIDGVVGDVFWHAGRSPAYGEGISYWSLAEMVRGRAGVAETDDDALALKRLGDALVEWVPDQADRRWIEPRLAALLGLQPMPSGSRDELFAAWRAFFERIADRGPTVLVFEDLQWADDGLIDFVEELVEQSRNHPILVITLARPELFERRSGWGSKIRSFTAMALDPLDPEQITEMIRGAVPGIPERALTAIVDRAEGVPLYAVEMVRMLIDRGQLRVAADGRYEVAGAIDRLAIPETLHALIAARLDSLAEHERKLLQTAAVTGQSFTLEALSAVAGEPQERIREPLAGLVGRQFLRVDVDPRSPERGQHQFVQAVVQEVAEQSLARADRRELHLAAARYYESLGDDELAGVLASHYVDAYRATPRGPEADALAAQARVSLRGAAERATSLHSHAQALSYLEQALEVTPEAAEQVALHERAATAAEQLSRVDTAIAHARAVETLNRELGDRLGVLRGLTLQAGVHVSQHAERPAIELLRRALDDVEDLDPSPESVRAQAQLARALMIGAAYAEAVEWCNRVLASGMATDEETVEVLITKGTALIGRSGREAEVLLRGAMEVAERLGLWGAALRARNNFLGLLQTGSQSETEAVIAEGFALAQRVGLRTRALQFAHVGLTAAFESGAWDAWMTETEELEPEGFFLGWSKNERALRAAFRGRLDEARATHREVEELIGSSSSQAVAGLAQSLAAIHVAACDWQAVMPAARRGWGHSDSVLATTVWAIVAGTATGSVEWITEATDAIDAGSMRGRLVDGLRSFAQTGVALTERRWPDARSHFIAARTALDEVGARLWLGLLNLSVGQRGAGHFPEAAQAARDAEEFFDSVGARPFLERYRGSVVPVGIDATPSAAAQEARAHLA